MSRTRLPAALCTLVLAASPSSALAQSAGDDQYEDPFGDEAPQTATPEPSGPQTAAPDPAPAPAPQAPATGASEPKAVPSPPSAPSAPVAASAGELPRTGTGTGLLGAGGVALVLCGVALRLRLADGGRGA